MQRLILIYITGPSIKEARRMAKALVGRKLVACANIWPINSIYRWKGTVVEDREFALLAKTTESKFNAVKKEVEKIHPYGIPCIIKIPASANKKYFGWLKSAIME